MVCNSLVDSIKSLRREGIIDKNNNLLVSREIAIKRFNVYNYKAKAHGITSELFNLEDNYSADIRKAEKLVRNSDGSRKRYSYDMAMNKARKINKANPDGEFVYRVKKVTGEKGDSRIYHGVFAEYRIDPADRYTVKYNINNFRKIDESLLKNSQNRKDIDESKEGYNDDADYMFGSFEGESSIMTPDFTKLRQFKLNQIKRLQKSLNVVKALKRENKDNVTKYKEYSALEVKISDILYGNPEKGTISLREKLKEMDDAGFLGELAETAIEDLKIAQDLIEIGSFDNLTAAREVVDFYKALIDFDVRNTNHPLFSFEEETVKRNEDGSLAISQQLKDLVGTISGPLEKLNIDLDMADKKLIKDHVLNYSKIKNLNKEVSWNDLFPSKGMKDISLYDTYMMDITNGLTASNGLVPQFMASYLGDVIAKASFKSRKIVEALDKKDSSGQTLQDRVTSKLRRLDKKYQIGRSGASYDFFRQRDSNDSYTGGIIQRFTSDFYNRLYKANQDYFESRKNAFNSQITSRLLTRASNKHKKWLKDNVTFIDSSKFREVYEALGEAVPSNFDDTWEERVKNNVGEKQFNEIKQQVIQKAKEYKVQEEIYIDNLINETDGATSVDDLDIKGKSRLHNWKNANNPILTSENYYGNTNKDLGTLFYNVMIPKKDSNDYDENFKIIEQDSDLSAFYDILKDFRTQLDGLDYEAGKKIFKNGIPSMEQSILEILRDPNTKILTKISKTYKKIIENILDLFREIKQDENQVGLVNPLTGRPDYKVNSDFLKDNQSEIDSVTSSYLTKIASVLNLSLANPNYTVDFKNLTSTQKERVFSVLQDLYGVTSEKELKDRLPAENFNGEVDLKSLTKAAAKHRVIANESMDMPKIIKFYTKMISEYEARTMALPMLQSIKSRYEEIDDVATTKEGLTLKNIIKTGRGKESKKENRRGEVGKRANAVRQMDSWFQRAALGNYGSRSEFGDLTLNSNVLSKKEKEILNLLQEQERLLKEELKNDKLPIEDANMINRALAQNAKRQAKLGKKWSMKKGIDSLFTFNRFRGLGYNLNSYLTNFLEGQTSNIFTDASGDYFKTGLIYKANNVVKGSLLPNIGIKGGTLKTKGALKTRVLMDRYDVLQDATNELQRASKTSVLSKGAQLLSPYEGTQRVEYLNQAPLMVAILMDTQIKGKDSNGNEITSSVWDAMDEDGKLIEGFNTEENNHNWVDGLGQQYLDTKAKIDKCIVNTHGDYHQLKGNLASEYITGKAFLMFKRWLSRQIYNRFALVDQVDLEAGIPDFKGRYLSHDKVSGAMHGAILGLGGLSLIGAGPIGLVIGGAVGFARGKLSSRNSPTKLTAADSLRELAFLTGQLVLNPIKYFVNNVTGKQIIKEGDYEKYLPGYTARDIKNIRTNIAEMSMTLLWLGSILMAKAALYDDEDEDDSPRRMAHNLIMNRLNALLGSLSMYSNPLELKKSILDPAFLTLLEDVKKFGDRLHKFTMGEDMLLTGANAGKSGLLVQTKKTFFPSIVKGNFGFESQMSRQFSPTPFDSLFWGEEKTYRNKNSNLRMQYKNKLRKEGVPEELIDEAVKKRYPSKKSDKSQREWYEEIKNNEELSIEEIKIGLMEKTYKKERGSRKKSKYAPSAPKPPKFNPK